MTVYRIVHGNTTIRSDEHAQRVGEFLEKRFGDEPVTPEQYVAVAKPARSPVHDTLEWNDTLAAHQHRLDQARSVLRSIMVVTDPSQRVQPRAYHSVSLISEEGAHRAYLPQHVVWAKEELAEQVVAEALQGLRSWSARYSIYKEKLQTLREANQHVDQALEILQPRQREE